MIYCSVSSVLIDTLSITSTCWSILYIKSYVCTRVEIIRSRYDVLHCIWRLYASMFWYHRQRHGHTVPTRFDALQFKNILTLKISGSFIGANTVDTAMPRSLHNQLLVNS